MREYLKKLRNLKRLKQEDVAKKLCISESYYSQIENGERQKDLPLSTIQKFAKLFEVKIDWLIQEEEKIKNN